MGQRAIADTLTHALEQARIAPAYLFCGPRGTGKTSSARILAKSLNCQSADAPTPQPCGHCEVCQSVSRGNALDIVEIDAASNTGVDNIRELIERAQFAPVQCRYKAYVIDECLTGDTQVATDAGSLRIDDPKIVGRRALSYNETLKMWEFKKIVRLLDQGKRPTYTVETNQSKIRCTGNHLIRTSTGWIAAKDLKEGMRILSPANVDAAPLSSSTEPIDVSVGFSEGISSRGIPQGKSLTALRPFSALWSLSAPYAPVAAENDLECLNSCSRKGTVLKVFSRTGKGILTVEDTAFGRSEPKTSSIASEVYPQLAWGLSMGLCWETVPSPFQTHIVDFQGWPGHIAGLSRLGQNTKQVDCLSYAQALGTSITQDMEKAHLLAVRPATQSFWKFFKSLTQTVREKESLLTGSSGLPRKVLLGGIWTMDPSALRREVARAFSFIQKGLDWRKISSLLAGFQLWDIQPKQALTSDLKQADPTITSQWEPLPPESSWQTSSRLQSLQWHTSLETVRSVQMAGVEPVYDIEVEGNHNFVANGLLVHNCHMLSTAAFNALLKTLEEPPDRVVFVLATTDPQRVLPTITSRCQRFDFRRIPLSAMVKHLSYIAGEEAINIADSAIQLVAQISQGGLRDAESLLDQLSLQADEITVESVWNLVGAVPERDLLNLVRAIAADDSTALLERTRQLMDKGREPLIVLQSLVGFYRDLLIAKNAPARDDLVAVTPPTWAKMTDFATGLSAAQLLAGQQQLQAAEGQVKNTTQPRLWLEITLTGLLPSALGAANSLVAGSADSTAAITARSVLASPPPPPAQQIAQKTPQKPAQQTPQKPAAADPPPAQDAKPPASEPTPAPDVAFGSLDELWAKILAALKPRGTQMLMSQQGVLLGFDGVGAKVGFRSASLQRMAQERIPNLTTAFEAVFQRPIRVSLEVLVAESVDEEEEPPSTPAPPPQAFALPDAPPAPASPRSDTDSPKREQATKGHANGHSASSPAQIDSIEPNVPPAPPPAESSSSAAEMPADRWEVDQDQDNIKRFAQFFNGQIVDLDDDLDGPSERAIGDKSSDPGPDVPF